MEPILIGGFRWCGTNTTSVFVHLSQDIFTFYNGNDALHIGIEPLKSRGRGQICGHPEFAGFVAKKNSEGPYHYDRVAVRENHLILDFYNVAIRDRNIHEDFEKAKLICCMRRPYDLWFSWWWRATNREMVDKREAQMFALETELTLEKCYFLKRMGHDIVFTDVTVGDDLAYRKILRLIGIEPTELQRKWMQLNPPMNEFRGKRKSYNEIKEKLRDMEAIFENLNQHPAIVETYEELNEVAYRTGDDVSAGLG